MRPEELLRKVEKDCYDVLMDDALMQGCPPESPQKPLVEALQDEVRRLRNLLEHDRTGLARALVEVCRLAHGSMWIATSRGPYSYDDDRYRLETGWALQRIEQAATRALHASGDLVNEAFQGICRPTFDQCKTSWGPRQCLLFPPPV